jgi:polyisoprenoid-binding protein YceI
MADELTRKYEGQEVPVAATYKIDTAHSTIGFVARHLVVSKVRGEFRTYSGSIEVAEDPTQSKVSVEIDMDSISTREEGRDNHLKSADFFEVEKHPKMTFESTAVRLLGGDKWAIDGNLSIKGITKPVTLDAEFNGASPDPWGGARIGFSASTEIDRDEFGVNFNATLDTGGVVVSKNIRIEIEIEAIKS